MMRFELLVKIILWRMKALIISHERRRKQSSEALAPPSPSPRELEAHEGRKKQKFWVPSPTPPFSSLIGSSRR